MHSVLWGIPKILRNQLEETKLDPSKITRTLLTNLSCARHVQHAHASQRIEHAIPRGVPTYVCG